MEAIHDTNAHQMRAPDHEGVSTCARCDLRYYAKGQSWQRKKGGHWRKEFRQPVPACFEKARTPAGQSSAT